MITKIQAYLISRYPLLWNTRIVFLLPIIFGIHVLFYLAGFFKHFNFGDLHDSRYYRYEGVVMFSVLLTALLIIIWLIFYLRNNPLKAGYPLKRFHLIKEFLLLMVVFFSSATFFFTYQQGVYNRSESETREINMEEEVDDANLAFHFIASEVSPFRIYHSCDSLAARDKRREKRLEEYRRLRDAGLDPDSDMINNEPIEESLDTLPLRYLYYCNTRYSLNRIFDAPSRMRQHDRAHGWLLAGNRDSVLYQLTLLKGLLEKYRIANNFDPESHVSRMFAADNFEVDTIYGTVKSRYDDYLQKDIPQAFVRDSDFQDVVDKIQEVRSGFWDWKTILFMFYYAFSMALLLMSFRITSIRVWFAALIGSGLVAILVSLVVVTSNQGELALYLTWLLYIVFLLGALVFIRNREHKFLSGVLFLWTLWLQLSMIPMIWAKLEDYYGGIYDGIPGNDETHPTYTWLNRHWQELLEFNLVFTFILLLVFFMPFAKKWQANPEE